jgi:uncharacterized protein (TIGR04255 family)
MDAAGLSGPFDGRHVSGIRLEAAPLATVVAQVRHPDLSRLNDSAANDLASALADSFPIFGQERQFVFAIGEDGSAGQQSGPVVWRLTSNDQQWQVSFSRGSVSLQTTAYDGRPDFRRRLSELLVIYSDIAKPPRVDRVGLRYVNRLEGDDCDDVADLVRPELLSTLTVPMPNEVQTRHLVTQGLYMMTDRSVQAQWGLLPPGAVFDPTVRPTDSRSWLLDIDSFTERSQEGFDSVAIDAMIVDLADTAYNFFRWAVLPPFIDRFKEAR